MFERFSRSARAAVRGGVLAATEEGADRLTPEHLLLGVLGNAGTAAFLAARGITPESARERVELARRRGGLSTSDAEALGDLGIDVDAVVAAVERAHGEGALAVPRPRRRSGRVPVAPETKLVLQRSLLEVRELGGGAIEDAHLLLAVLRTGGPAADVLSSAGVTRPVLAALARA
ncbi:Clp protease N-terminal domain-containing protein [Actinokineospora bangkokensis]|uniref:Clp R domain-containing protein n=1 Tax=Actinokineospora bangkokensis TaxID=1193682 RepID=A0A1Q9LFH3_9PSEU|nr:Clp protease N-terminal domain-containing protein [Actinokineospora bangkokensis]OLR90786.1 hypothetical protein BJP25_29860 [Actinokineospora bangkokensis]